MDLDWLKDFLALAEHKTFSRAADARNVTQPAYSRRIRALEDWVGAPLFLRSAQGAVLTSAGERFRPGAEELARRLEQIRREARAAGDRETVTLSIAATHALSFTFIPGWVRGLMQESPVGTLNLVSDSMEGCEQVMLAGEVHFLVCHAHPLAPTRFEPDRFPSIPVGKDRLIPLCAPKAGGEPKWSLPGADAARVPCLAYSQASGLGRILAASLDKTIMHTVTSMTSHLAATLMTMARDGDGVAWLPETLARDDLERGRLVRAGPERFDVPIEIRLFRSMECRNDAADAVWARLNL